ncbi:MAG: efflux RND transporter periplasmic adaptor subunit [bacterium]|nr:efflux RND transporter periplasmic adaptor subunit [bacterium]
MNTRTKKIVFPILIAVAAIATAALMMANRITPDRLEVDEQVIPVEVTEIVHTDEEVIVTVQGTVTAAQQVMVRPEVAGRIVDLSPSLVPGGLFTAGETIVSIDERDYRVQSTVQKEAVARARLALRQERARKAVAEEEWELLEESIPSDESNRDLALRIPQIEQAEAAIAAAEGTLAKAELDLERCTVTAPFNSVVLREQVDLGQLVNPQTEIATLVGTDAYWVQVSLPIENLEWIEIPWRGRRHGSKATIIHSAGSVEISRVGRIDRLLGDVDPAGRMARLLIVIDDPLHLKGSGKDSDLPLLLGSYVTVEIHGKTIEDAVLIPRRALREIHVDGDNGAQEGLWIMDDDDRLSSRIAEVIWRTEQTVVVGNGFTDGARLITSSIATPIEGMKLTVAESPSQGND